MLDFHSHAFGTHYARAEFITPDREHVVQILSFGHSDASYSPLLSLVGEVSLVWKTSYFLLPARRQGSICGVVAVEFGVFGHDLISG